MELRNLRLQPVILDQSAILCLVRLAKNQLDSAKTEILIQVSAQIKDLFAEDEVELIMLLFSVLPD